MPPKFFRSQSDFRKWLEKNHDKRDELVVGFHKSGSGKKSISYQEALDEALCFGWIDGVRKRVDDLSYSIRFTPRKPRSIWSLINVRHVERLTRLGLMSAAGLRAFALRDEKRTGIYSFENAPKTFSTGYLKQFKANKKAWAFFEAQPPSYRRLATFWVMSAKREETQVRRLTQLIENSTLGIRDRVVTGKAKEPSD